MNAQKMYMVLGLVVGLGFALQSTGFLAVPVPFLAALGFLFPMVYFLGQAQKARQKGRTRRAFQQTFLALNLLILAVCVGSGIYNLFWFVMPVVGLLFALPYMLKTVR